MRKMPAPSDEPIRRELIEARALLAGLAELSQRAGHDLAGPLNQAASLLALFIKRYRDRLDPGADRLLEFLQSASTNLEGAVAAFRQYMEIAGGSMIVGPVDLNASLAASLARLEKAILENCAVIVPDLLPVVSADAARMATIFEILIGNSIKFRKPDVPPHIRISLRKTRENTAIAIADNGIGIDPEHHEIVFLPFKRLNGRKYAGAGVGLAMAKLMIGMHGGSIRIESGESGGICVLFTVPPA